MECDPFAERMLLVPKDTETDELILLFPLDWQDRTAARTHAPMKKSESQFCNKHIIIQRNWLKTQRLDTDNPSLK